MGHISRRAFVIAVAALTMPAFPQSPASAQAQKQVDGVKLSETEVAPERTLKFSLVKSDPTISISPVTSIPQCSSDGSLFIDMLDPKDLDKHTLVSFYENKSRTYYPSLISDLHDVTVLGFYPTKSVVGFLVRGTKEAPGGGTGSGKSPSGFSWSSYHYYVAEFNLDGTYRESVELPISNPLSRLAIFPSGEFLVVGYDQLNAAVRLLLLDSSGHVSKTLDIPAARTSAGAEAPYGSIEAAHAARNLVGSIALTPYDQDILVWRGGSNDPVLEVGSGGAVREVPLQVPSGFVFVEMVPANDRWVAHFRIQGAAENSAFSQKTYSYSELRPQDGSVSSRLVIPPDDPQFLACEKDGNYIAYKLDKDNKLMMLSAN